MMSIVLNKCLVFRLKVFSYDDQQQNEETIQSDGCGLLSLYVYMCVYIVVKVVS